MATTLAPFQSSLQEKFERAQQVAAQFNQVAAQFEQALEAEKAKAAADIKVNAANQDITASTEALDDALAKEEVARQATVVAREAMAEAEREEDAAKKATAVAREKKDTADRAFAAAQALKAEKASIAAKALETAEALEVSQGPPPGEDVQKVEGFDGDGGSVDDANFSTATAGSAAAAGGSAATVGTAAAGSAAAAGGKPLDVASPGRHTILRITGRLGNTLESPTTSFVPRPVTNNAMFAAVRNAVLVNNDVVYKIREEGARRFLLCCDDDGSLVPALLSIDPDLAACTLTLVADLITSESAMTVSLQNAVQPVVSIYAVTAGKVTVVRDDRLDGFNVTLCAQAPLRFTTRSGSIDVTLSIDPGSCVLVLHVMSESARRRFLDAMRGRIEGSYDDGADATGKIAQVQAPRRSCRLAENRAACWTEVESKMRCGLRIGDSSIRVPQGAPREKGLFANTDLPPGFHFPYVAKARWLRCDKHRTNTYCVTASIPADDEGEQDRDVRAEGKKLVADGDPDIVTAMTGNEVCSFAARINEPPLGSRGYTAMMVDNPSITARDYYDSLRTDRCIVPGIVVLPFGATKGEEIFMWYGKGFKRSYPDFTESTDPVARANIETFDRLLHSNTVVNALHNQSALQPQWYRCGMWNGL
ncbi:hypothetical protein JKP88DRAFT_241765 [Tribonema minus]|uniref:Uncharacterized protein n=1 Tax=Tribonema minus TaxID=303371 RepID=A0A836CD93_9STRA|nr:hypothetical protein JKP88DRAFT_241765 [Tribonema minus]